MNVIQYISVLAFILVGFGQSGFAQEAPQKKIEEITFQTEGVCFMCKERIEGALDIKGIRFASWDKETGKTTVAYRTDILTPEDIHQRLAAVGHSTNLIKADTTVYQTLPGCCHYDHNHGTVKH